MAQVNADWLIGPGDYVSLFTTPSLSRSDDRHEHVMSLEAGALAVRGRGAGGALPTVLLGICHGSQTGVWWVRESGMLFPKHSWVSGHNGGILHAMQLGLHPTTKTRLEVVLVGSSRSVSCNSILSENL